MYLRRLEVHGFKAFAERQRFEFGPGMTVIAGPNGSGKSNVADALRWALGETSARQIRARKTEDIIFSGSEKRRPMGMAEVTLTLDNSEGWMPIDYSEVAVTRRAHRSGENEYAINGTSCRLGDVLDLFRRAQVGQNSYAHMSQGLVDEVLALRPQERRELIEEAADLRRHRHQLTLSERRLVETRDNLGHVRMLIREVEPRIKALQRQSRRAARYRELARELADALEVYFEAELRSAREAQTSTQARHDQRAQAFAVARDAMAGVEARLREVETIVRERRAALEVAQGRERELSEEGLRLEQAVALAEQRLELLAERRTELEAAVAATDLPSDDASVIDATIAAFDARVTESQTALARAREALTSADEATRAVLRELSEAEARRARLEAEADDTQRRIVEAQRRAEQRAADRTAAGEQRTTLLAAATEHEALLARHVQEAQSLDDALRLARERRESAERRLEEEQRAQQAAQEAFVGIETSLKQLEDRLRLIEMLRDSVPAGADGTEALLEAGRTKTLNPDEGLSGIVDAVSRLIRVPEGLEAAIESALAEHLGAVVVETYDDAIAAVAYLREQGAGVATVLPLHGMDTKYPLNLFNERGVVGIASRLVRCDQKVRPLIDTLLGRVIVVEDLRVAEQMITRGLGSVVTRDGILLRPGGAVYGGRAGGSTEHFSMQRELDSLPAQIEAARSAVEPARARVAHAAEIVADARDAVTQARRAVDEATERRRQHDVAKGAIERRQTEITAELRAVELRLQPQPDESDAGLAERLTAARAAVTEVAAQIASIRDRSEAVGAERDAAAERATLATQSLAGVEAEHRALAAQRDERVAARRNALDLLTKQKESLDAIRREQEDLDLTLRDRRERLANNRALRTEAQAAVGPAHAAVAELAEEERTLAATRGDQQRTLLAAEREMLESEHGLRQAAERVTRLLEEIEAEGMTVQPDGTVKPLNPLPAPVASTATTDDRIEDSVALPEPVRGGAELVLDDVRARISDLRAEIRSLGPVNVEAVEDLASEEERYTFLSTQVADLEAAEVELREAIRDLKKLIRARFVETFEVVNERFAEYFRRFFGGGQAELRLIVPEEVEGEEQEREAGVEIVAQPPGKRISNLAVLSGGERSMTSVALLFALLSVNPAPVVVLDEVDAALDEANVGRFVDTLLELRERTQFVVISHNRRTIEAADAIYGISMGDDSTSQVLSLRLADLPRAG
ncbi:MAG: chromosome segregation protein SMC [Dehalococcoidia bacterium]|nr:MAG: chromosome segregation protein SMC [Dehalococcoidia bacterium]